MRQRHRSARTHRHSRIAAALLVFASCAQAVHGESFPLAELAAGSHRLASTVDTVAGSDTALAIAGAVGGAATRQALLTAIGYFSTALDVPRIADRQWLRALTIAERRGDDRAIGALLVQLSQSSLAVGQYERGIDIATRLRAFAHERGDANAEGVAENSFGVIERRRGRLDAAIAHQQQAIALFQRAGNGVGAMRALSDLGTAQRDRGDFTAALKAHLEAIGARERSGDRLANAYRNLALLYREIEDIAASKDYFRRATENALQGGVPSVYSSVTGAWSSLLNDIGEYGAARTAAGEALAIDTALGDLPHEGFEHLETGRALIGLKDAPAAEAELEQALAIGRSLGQREIVARSLLHLTEIALARSDHLRARGLIDEAMAGLEATRLRPQLAQAYALREQLARAEHDDAAALRFAHKASLAREELIGIRASRQLAALEVNHARSDAEQRVAMLAKDNELQAARLEAQSVQRRFGLTALGGLLLALGVSVWRYRGIRRLNRDLALRNDEIERQRAALGAANETLQRQAADLYAAATTDSLTGVSNRRYVLDRLEERLAADGAPLLAVMLVDFDNFKQVNDRCGHLFGDQVLVAGARAMRERLADDDLLGRFGGEEFIIVVQDRSSEAVLALAEKLREDVAARLAWLAPELRSIATISIGIAFLADIDPARSGALLEAADQALYAAKNAGRNRVHRFAA